jgi:Lar family restriction alleviation protein
MNRESNELKPCPFCGSADLRADPEDMLVTTWVTCNKCGSQGPYGDTPKGAIEAWNKRLG